jgi:hypothetical protein
LRIVYLQSDARVLRVVLSLTGVKEGLKGHVVVEMSDLDNEQLVKLVGGDLVETVVAHDVIGRLMIQCARQPGLAQVRSLNPLHLIELVLMFATKSGFLWTLTSQHIGLTYGRYGRIFWGSTMPSFI